MSDTTDKTTKKSTLTLGSSKLKLGDIKGGQVSQNLAHGKTAKVQVEVVRKKRRFSSTKEEAQEAQEKKNSFKQNAEAIKNDDGLTESERSVRMKVLEQASKQDKEKAAIEEEKAKKRKEKAEQEEAIKAEEEKLKKEKQAKQKAQEPVVEEVQPNLVKPIRSNDRIAAPVTPKVKEKKEERKPSRQSENKRRSGKLTITQALSDTGEEVRTRSLASIRRAREKARREAAGDSGKEKEKTVRDVILPEVITVQELANRMAERSVDVTKALMKMGMMVTANQSLDADTAELVVSEFGHNVRRVTDADVEDILKDDGVDNDGNLVMRAPVVTFMGHVDHGKTSLLDAIRKAKVADGEAGGITQHIGAYQVNVHDDQKITFLDTPGHEAFTAMRQRGANATDVVVLVVAADDGIMAQTVEAINHAKAAEVPIIVAINKIDKEGADPQRVRTALLEHELVTEDMGGDIIAIEVSAKTGSNLDSLLESILLQAEILELKANPSRKSSGIVVESRVDKSKGVISTFLVQKGTLKIADIVIVGEAFGRVRAMKSDSGRVLKNAGPSVPVEVLGLDEAPEAGVEFHVVDSEKQAREIKEYRQKHARDVKSAMQQKKGTLDDLFLRANDSGQKELPVLIKGDVQGSVEAIIGSLDKLATDEVGVRVLHSAVGGITSSDVILANASNAIVLAFNVRADASAKELMAKDGGDIRYYSIIYDLIDDMKAILGGMLAPTVREVFLGTAVIREVFNVTRSGKVAGCLVNEGIIKRGAGVRLLRDNVVIHEGKLKTLKRFKDDVKEVGTNFECGMAFENYEDIKEGDVIEAFELVEEQRTL